MTDHRGMPGRVPPEFPAAFAEVPGTFEPIRIPLPPTPDDAARVLIRVRPQDIDPMGHVNNAAYMDYLEEALLAAGEGAAEVMGATPRRARIEYLQAAAPGAILTAEAWAFGDDEGDGWAWRLVDEPGGRDLARGRILRG
jgi:acyl-ACP thioesterase